MAETANTKTEMRTGKHRPGYRPPRMGEKRRTRQPLWIDRLGQNVRDAIVEERALGKTWLQVSQAVSPLAGRRLACSTLARWFDLRIEQPQREAQGSAALLSAMLRLTQLIESRFPQTSAKEQVSL
ncbi:MAG: hypothetical protein LAO20_10350 [Acidobacteriia bacterium]|nr:hypothetical protein [Terriglobia bacterium]